MTANMDNLYQQLQKEGIKDITFLSFSVDPQVDTPDKIKEFMNKYDLSSATWHFLSGYSQEDINKFAEKNFHK